MKILIVDDHKMFREGLKMILSNIGFISQVDDTGSGIEFLDKLKKQLPDIVLLDIMMPNMDGMQASEIALEKFPELKIIALSSYGEEYYYYRMTKTGVKGFVQKDAGIEELTEAIKEVANGECHFSKEILRNIIVKISNEGQNSLMNKNITLSSRETEVLMLICQGYSNKEIAEVLFLSPKTIDNYRTSLLEKTETKNAAHLVMFAIKNKLVEI